MDEVDAIFVVLFLILAVLSWHAISEHFQGRKIMPAIDNLNTNIQKLSTDIDAFIASHGSNNEAQIQAAADAVQAADDKVVAATPQS